MKGPAGFAWHGALETTCSGSVGLVGLALIYVLGVIGIGGFLAFNHSQKVPCACCVVDCFS